MKELELFDRGDMRDHYNKGFWIGAISASASILVVLFLTVVFLIY